jgi:hypothetical protein
MSDTPKKQSGKGSKPRPFAVPLDDFGSRFEAIFGKKKKKTMPLFTYGNTVKTDEEEAKEKAAKAEKIAKTEPFKTKMCPHCATFNLIRDPDMEGWLLCKKCRWNDSDPYTE